MLAVTVSQVVALLSSALSGAEAAGGGGMEMEVGAKVAAGGERWRRRGGHDRAAAGYCCVCISACRDGEEIRSLPCGHAFHRDCVDRWLVSCKQTCPLCRVYVADENRHPVAAKHTGREALADDLVIWFSTVLVPGF